MTLAAHVFVEDITIDGIEATVRAYATGGLGTRLERHHGEGTDALFHAWADTWLAPWFRQLERGGLPAPRDRTGADHAG